MRSDHRTDSESELLFLDAILTANPRWQMIFDSTTELIAGETTITLLAKAHSRQIWQWSNSEHSQKCSSPIGTHLSLVGSSPTAQDLASALERSPAMVLIGRDTDAGRLMELLNRIPKGSAVVGNFPQGPPSEL
jgi:hypothetical protein